MRSSMYFTGIGSNQRTRRTSARKGQSVQLGRRCPVAGADLIAQLSHRFGAVFAIAFNVPGVPIAIIPRNMTDIVDGVLLGKRYLF